MTHSEALDKAVLMLVSGVKADAAEAALVEKLGLAPPDAKAVLVEARNAITVAADYNRAEEIGTAYLRLNDLYTRAIKTQDVKAALAAQRELNKLLSLYEKPAIELPTAGEVPDTPAQVDHELDAIRSHLEPLGLAPPGYPLRERARIAAERIRDTQGS